MTMDVTQAILSRRSVRKYTTESISDEDIEALLNADMRAPSAVNEQPWHYIVVKDRKTIDAIPQISPTALMVKDAPVAIVVCADTQLEDTSGNDVSVSRGELVQLLFSCNI